MPFRYSCFISFRHGQRALAERIINDLYDALSNEMELFLSNKKVYVDWERLQGGDFYNEALALALCESVCMVVVFTPTYFDKEHTFCAREYKAMEELEKKRLKLLSSQDDKEHGLIIPIIFRGEKFLPAGIKSRRHYYNFENFLLCNKKISQHRDYALKIKKIAEYIADRCMTLEALDEDPCGGCESFTLPPEEEIRHWIEEVKGSRMPFPRA
jgi:hypothetical protein